MLKTIISFFSALYAQATNSVTSCGGEFQSIQGKLYPDELIHGRDAYFFISYDVPNQVNAGTVETSLKINNAIYPIINGNLCNTVNCPIKVGHYESNTSFPLTDVDGFIHSKIRWFSDAGTLLLCMKIMVDILPAN